MADSGKVAMAVATDGSDSDLRAAMQDAWDEICSDIEHWQPMGNDDLEPVTTTIIAAGISQLPPSAL